VQLADDLVAEPSGGFDVQAGAGCCEPELGQVRNLIGEVGDVQERLRRNAPAVQARATHLVGLDDGDPQPTRRGAQCCGVAAGSASEHGDVVGHRRR
jgi:hypothetical protein